MRKTRQKKSLSLILCIVLIAAMALFTTGCNGSNSAPGTGAPDPDASVSQPGGSVLGQGETSFTFEVVDGDGNETSYQINTDKETVGDALLELNLIDGEDGDYGLYVKTVNGVTVDYDTDGKYWAFYVDGEYAMSGVDTTDITAGSTYAFKVE